jgi:hypothetical protein
MTPDIMFEQYCAYVTTLNKKELMERLLHFDGPIRLDFTAEYLESLDTDKLRHILLAAVLTVERKKIVS